MESDFSDRADGQVDLDLNFDTITILMVEDNPDHVQLARTALEKHGFWLIDVATTMAEAFEMMRSHQYRVLLVDYCLPDGYGIDLLDWVDEDCTVVMMTAQGNEKVAAEAFRRGALDYVVKDSLFREVLPEIVEQAVVKNEAIKRAIKSSRIEPVIANNSAVVYSQMIPFLNGYLHTDHLKTSLAKIRRHLTEIRGCIHIVRYNPEEPVTENQCGFLESAMESCELVEDLLTRMVLGVEDKTGS